MSDWVTRLTTALEARYRIERQLGEGGMAMVYLADDLRHHRKVAIKVLKPELALALGAERFLVEIDTTANLQHPHILPLFDSGERDGFLYYVMPFVQGESLRHRLDRERELPVAEAVRIARDVAEALDYAHRHGVIHRDIKPGNILLHEGNPLVADFGIAVAMSAAGGERLTGTGTNVGTPLYMSPEQASGERDVSGRSDVYSLACVLYEALTGRPPHAGGNSRAILARILTEQPPAVTESRPSVPANVASALSRALEKLPADRFGSAADFANALDDPDYRYEGSVLKPSATGGVFPRRGDPGRARWLSAWQSRAALGALAVVALLLLWSTLVDRAGVPADPVIFSTAVPLDSLEVPLQLALSPDGRTLVFVSQRPGEVPSLYRRRSDEEAITRIPGTENASDPEFSPDGRWVVFVQERTELKRMRVEGGTPLDIQLESDASGDVLSAGAILADPSWGPDGSILFAAQHGLYQVPAEGGTVRQILSTPLFSSHVPRHVVGTDRVLYTHQPFASMDPEIRLLDLESGRVTPIVQGSDGRYLPDLSPGHLLYATLDGSMVAARFDPEEGRLAGSAVSIIEHVGIGPAGQARMHFAVAESGSAVYAVGSLSGFEEVLVTVGWDGVENRIPGLPVGNYSQPRYDPSGRYVAFELESRLFVRDLVLGSQSLLSDSQSYNPVWSRDGSRIAFGWSPPSDPDDGTAAESAAMSRLLVRPSDLSSEAEVLLESPFFVPPTAWSPGDSLIIYSGRLENSDAQGAEIWYVSSMPPADPRPFLRGAGWDEGFANLSPDGRWVAYESDVSGQDAVYVQSFPIPGERRKVSEGGGVGARWAVDGQSIFYRSGDTVKVAHVRTEPDFAVVSNEVLKTGPYVGIDPHPDGTGFMAIKRLQTPESARERRLIWVVNWLGYVRARLEGR